MHFFSDCDLCVALNNRRKVRDLPIIVHKLTTKKKTKNCAKICLNFFFCVNESERWSFAMAVIMVVGKGSVWSFVTTGKFLFKESVKRQGEEMLSGFSNEKTCWKRVNRKILKEKLEIQWKNIKFDESSGWSRNGKKKNCGIF